MNIHIKISNALTRRVEVDNTVNVDYDFDTMDANARCFSEAFPDCCVTLSAENGDFVCLPAHNQKLDEERVRVGLMQHWEYEEKWWGFLSEEGEKARTEALVAAATAFSL